MSRAALNVLISASFFLSACVPGGNAPAHKTPQETECAERATVARQLAERHQYGADLQAYISELARQGASAAQIADYRVMAQKLAATPRLAGDFGRETGVARSLEELGIDCSR